MEDFFIYPPGLEFFEEQRMKDVRLTEKAIAAFDENIVGLTAKAATALRRSGKIELNGKRYNAKSDFTFIDIGAQVKIVGYEGFELIVTEVEI